jgi:hypothetical protein
MRYKIGPMELVDYLFDFGDNKARGAWKKTSYRYMYQRTLSLIEEVSSKPAAEEWGRQLKKLVIFTCWLLPYACKETLFDRTKPNGGEPSKLMWFSSYQTNQPEEFMELYNTRVDSDQGDDFRALLRLVHIYPYWQTGRKGKVLHGQPLKSKMVLEMHGLSPHAREEYYANLMT